MDTSQLNQAAVQVYPQQLPDLNTQAQVDPQNTPINSTQDNFSPSYQDLGNTPQNPNPTPQNSPQNDSPNIELPPPPIGDSAKADKYLNQITDLLAQNQLNVTHTDLKQYDPTTLQDHYRVDLSDYEVEISHSKAPDTNQEFHIMLFNNLQKVANNCTNKVVLAYIHLTPDQFKNFKDSADKYLEQKKILEQENKFNDALRPIDDLLNNLTSQNQTPLTLDNNEADTTSKESTDFQPNSNDPATTLQQPMPN